MPAQSPPEAHAVRTFTNTGSRGHTSGPPWLLRRVAVGTQLQRKSKTCFCAWTRSSQYTECDGKTSIRLVPRS